MTTKTKAAALLRIACGAALGALVAAGPANAADMTAPAYKVAPMPAYNWSGFYVGLTAGGGMASLPVTDMDNLGFANGPELKSGGAVAGLHAGYNWHFAPSFLVGIEGDFNWSSFKASDTTCFGICGLEFAAPSAKLDAFGTLRARFGLTQDRTLVYVTAGPAWGHIKSLTQVDLFGSCVPGAIRCQVGKSEFASDSSFHVGVALGAGVEYALTQNWIFRAEYLHLDFASKDAVFKDLGLGGAPVGAPFTTFRASSTATADIARVGVSYKVW